MRDQLGIHSKNNLTKLKWEKILSCIHSTKTGKEPRVTCLSLRRALQTAVGRIVNLLLIEVAFANIIYRADISTGLTDRIHFTL